MAFTPTVSTPPPTYGRIAWLALPVILANSTSPLLGLVDTAVIGRTGTATDLGAIALGALLFNFIYWGFGFLRMSTSGFVSQASGANDPEEIAAVVVRAFTLALGIGVVLLCFQWPLRAGMLQIFGASDAVEASAAHYFRWRIWGAPASLSMYVFMGFFIGRSDTKMLLWLQLLLNGSNIALDILFAGVLGWGVTGIALGTTISETLVSLVAGCVVWRHLQQFSRPSWVLFWRALRNKAKLRETLHANGNIMVRTLFLLAGFAYFTDQSARFGDQTLAANHILLQFITFSAFFLDGYAHVTEAFVGQTIGAKKRGLFDIIVWRSTFLAAGTASALGLFCWSAGEFLIAKLTHLQVVQQAAQGSLRYASIYIALSFAAFQLDGIFIGATQTARLRNASIVATSVFVTLSLVLVPWAGNRGLWLAFLVFVVARAFALGIQYRNTFAKAFSSPPQQPADGL